MILYRTIRYFSICAQKLTAGQLNIPCERSKTENVNRNFSEQKTRWSEKIVKSIMMVWNLFADMFIFTMRHYASVVFAIVVCPSVTSLYCFKTTGQIKVDRVINKTRRRRWLSLLTTPVRQFRQKSFDWIGFSLPNRFFSIRFSNLINLPLVHWYSNSKLGVIALHNCFLSMF